jgi:hypothetical protein
LHKYRKPERKNKCVEIEEKYPSVFGKPLNADLPDDTIAEIPASEVLKLFFNPLITVFVLYSLFRAFVVLAM